MTHLVNALAIKNNIVQTHCIIEVNHFLSISNINMINNMGLDIETDVVQQQRVCETLYLQLSQQLWEAVLKEARPYYAFWVLFSFSVLYHFQYMPKGVNLCYGKHCSCLKHLTCLKRLIYLHHYVSKLNLQLGDHPIFPAHLAVCRCYIKMWKVQAKQPISLLLAAQSLQSLH